MPTVSISPAVQWNEVDLTAIVPSIATSIGAFAGDFVWGPVMEPTQVSNEGILASLFGKPNSSNYTAFFSAKNFLDYSSNLLLVRAGTATQKNAVSSGTAVVIKNEDDWEANYQEGANSVGPFAAKYPGALGNSLKVSIADAATFSRTLTGTVATTQGSIALTGTGTQFTNEVAVGDWITVVLTDVAFTSQVKEVTSATAIVLSTAAPATDSALTATAKWEYYAEFEGAPIDSERADAMGATGDSMHVVVVDEDGKFSGRIGSVLEKFDNIFKSKDATRFDGTSGFYKNALKSSSYIWWMDHPDSALLSATGIDFGADAAVGPYKNLKKPLTVSLIGGVDGTAANDGELISAYDLFGNDEKYDVSLLITGKVSSIVANHVIQNVAEKRMDCVAFVSCFDPDDGSFVIGDGSASADKLAKYRTDKLVYSSYMHVDSGVKYQYDKYNDTYRWVPLNADSAGLYARCDATNDAWITAAGLNRGAIKNTIKLAVNPDKPMRDTLFKVGVNPYVSFKDSGPVLFGDKTGQAKPSAFDAIGVRRLFIVLEKSIATAAKYFLFEQNDAITRQIFANMVNPYLRNIKGRRGIDDFLVDVGATVNTAEVINQRQFAGNIYIRPVGAIRNIVLSFIATPYGVSFSEYTGG